GVSIRQSARTTRQRPLVSGAASRNRSGDIDGRVLQPESLLHFEKPSINSFPDGCRDKAAANAPLHELAVADLEASVFELFVPHVLDFEALKEAATIQR